MATFSDYINVIRNSNLRTPKVKVELLRPDETPYLVITGDVIDGGGSINIENKNGQRRSVSFDLINVKKEYLPNPDGIWLRQKIRVWVGLEVNGEDFFINQGVFVLNNPTALSKSGDNRISIRASDKFALTDGSLGGELNGIYNIPVGTSLITAVKMILKPSTQALQEVLYDPRDPIIHSSFASIVTPYTMEKSAGEPIGDFLIELANMVSANVYYSTNGELIFEPDYEDSVKGSLIDLTAGDFNYIQSSQDYPLDKIYNAVLVIGDNINGEIFDALAENTDLRSPTSIPNVGFRRVLTIEDTNIYTDALALSRANYELKRVTNLLIEQGITSVPMYHLDADSVITVTDENLNIFDKRMLINSLSIPISTSGQMSIRCVDTVEL